MKKALLFAPMGSVHRRFNKANIQALQELGYEVHLLANFSDGDGPETHNSEFSHECIIEGIKIHSLPFHRGSLFKNIKLLPLIKKILNKEHFEIVHSHTETGGILLRLCKSVQNDTKFFFTPHGMSFYKGSSIISQCVYKPIERWICNGMNVNIAMNNEELENLKNWDVKSAKFVHGIGLNIDRMRVSSEKSRIIIRNELGIPGDSLMILSVGELNTNKNHSAVIKALSLLKEKDFYYVICGVGDLKDQLIKLAQSCGLESKVIIAGYRSDIPNVVSAADMFVFPSFHEGLPVSVLEAMAGGLPVIASAIRGNVDLIKDGVNGYLFNPQNNMDISLVIEKLITSASLREKMGCLNKQLAESYSFEVVKNELIDIYRNNRKTNAN